LRLYPVTAARDGGFSLDLVREFDRRSQPLSPERAQQRREQSQVDIDAVTTRQLVASHHDGSSDGESTTDDRSD
jgi:hypothetical protein